jgi:hypothetical protein
MSDIPAVDPEVIRTRRLEAERAAQARSDALRRRETWLVALRVALSVGLLLVSFSPIINETRPAKQHVVWEYVGAIGKGPEGLAGLWTLVTLLLVVAALVTPGGRVGRLRQWVTLAFLITFAGGHSILAVMDSAARSGFTVLAAYWVLVGLSAVTAIAWFPQQDIDARE